VAFFFPNKESKIEGIIFFHTRENRIHIDKNKFKQCSEQIFLKTDFSCQEKLTPKPKCRANSLGYHIVVRPCLFPPVKKFRH